MISQCLGNTGPPLVAQASEQSISQSGQCPSRVSFPCPSAILAESLIPHIVQRILGGPVVAVKAEGPALRDSNCRAPA